MARLAAGSQLRKTAAHSGVYALGTMLGRITSLVMLPIYTRYLTPADYGVLELLLMAIEISGILVGMRISQAMFRFYILANDETEKNVIVSTVLLSIVLTSCIGAGILYLLAKPLTILIFGDSGYQAELQMFAGLLVTNAITAVGLSYVRARRMPVVYLLIGVATLVLQVTLNVVFVVILELHVRGVVYSSLGSGIIVATAFLLYLFGSTGLKYSFAVARRLYGFVAPLIVASIAAFYVAYADKYFLRLFGSLATVGLYSLAARLCSILETLFNAFNMSWNADRYEIVKHDNAHEIFRQVFRFMSAVLVLAGAGLALFAGDFFRIMTDPQFYPASSIVPLLAAAVIVRIYAMFCNFGVMLGERTVHIAQASWLKVVVASAGYILLIPAIGVYGAALTLLASNLVEFYWINRYAIRYYDMQLPWKSAGAMLAAGVVCVVTGISLPVGEPVWLLARLLCYGFLVAVIYLMPVWEDDDRALMKSGFRKFTALRTRT
jgi:O-antigen/teichoic acid export membrane protein